MAVGSEMWDTNALSPKNTGGTWSALGYALLLITGE
jgi:hypothetical protein